MTLTENEISKLRVDELRRELKKRQKSTSGNKAELKERLFKRCRKEREEEEKTSLQNLKKAVEATLFEYVCPITCELPVDPVTAMDARTYERSAIEEWIQVKQRANLPVTSPVTNETLTSVMLLQNSQVYNAIENLVAQTMASRAISPSPG